MGPAYASKVHPLALRGYLTVYVNLYWAIGQLIAPGILRDLSIEPTKSPWWLVNRDGLDEAVRSITRLSNASLDSAEKTIALIMHTQRIEAENEARTCYLDCCKGVNLRRTEIACMVFAAQIWCGQSLGGTSAYFFVQAGLSPLISFEFSVGGLGLACIGTVISWFLLPRIGRRALYVPGLGILAVIMLVVAIMATASTSNGSSFGQAALVLIWLLSYYLTIGPVCHAIIAEIPASNVGNRSIWLSRIRYYLTQVVGNVISPYMSNPIEANWHGKTEYFFAGTGLIFFLWSFLRLPDIKDRTFEEIDILFAN